MTQVPLLRRILGWLVEGLWLLVLVLSTPLLFWWKKRRWEGHRKEHILILCDAFATPFLYLRLGRYFAKQGFSVSIFATGSIFRGLSEHSVKLSNFLEEEKLKNIIVLGHGLGGLIPLSLPDAPRRRIIHLAPLGSPLNGTRLFLPFTWIPALGDMTVGSEFILYNRTNAMLYADFTPFSNWQDECIVPFELARYGQGRDLILDRVGHLNLVWDKGNIRTILEIIQEFHPEPASIVQKAVPSLPAPPKKGRRAASKAQTKKIQTKRRKTAVKKKLSKKAPQKKSSHRRIKK